MISEQFIREIPKTDLHLHLDGSLRLATLIELAKKQKVRLPSYSESGLSRKVFKQSYQNLAEYLEGFLYTTAVLQTPEALSRCAYELAMDCFQENVCYIEIRFAPQLHINRYLKSGIDVLKAVNQGLEKAKKEINQQLAPDRPLFDYGIIICAMRMFNSSFGYYFQQLLNSFQFLERKKVFRIAALETVKMAVIARDEFGIPVVGFDLAGMEKGFPASDFSEAYALAHRNFLKKTVHAGEAFGPESIFQAITELYADRIGHGVHLFKADMIHNREIRDKEKFVSNLVQFIADRRITIEVCLTSNQQTNPELKKLENHSFSLMRENKLSVTFCTDNRLVSSTSVTAEILKAVNTFKITPKELRNFVIYGFKRSFFPRSYLEKRSYVRKILSYYDQLEKKFGIKRSE